MVSSVRVRILIFPLLILGPSLPVKMHGFSLVDTDLGVFALGGDPERNYSGDKYRRDILRLRCAGDQIQNCQWEKMPQQLEVPRGWHVSIPLPDSYDICQ